MKIIRDVHDQFFCVHSNMNRIEKLIKRYYYWFNIRKIIKRYIRNCHNCQRVKSFHDELIKLFRLLFIFAQQWINILMNFIIKLFNSKKHNVICTIINRLFKKRYYVFCTIDKKNIVVEIYVRILFHYIFRIHELFSFIISNRDFQFVNTIWKFFCKKLNIKNKLSIAFYSKTNDQTKRINQNIKTRFQYYCNYI